MDSVLSGLGVADARRVEHLRGMLAVSVPGWQQKIARHWHPAKRRARALICARELAGKGDTLMYGSKRHGQSALLFGYFAESVALLSFQPGGVTVFGVHFEAPA